MGDARDLLTLQFNAASVELKVANVDTVVAELRQDITAAEGARRQSQAEASVATANLARERARCDRATEDLNLLKVELNPKP